MELWSGKRWKRVKKIMSTNKNEQALRDMLEEAKAIRAGLERASESAYEITSIVNRILDENGADVCQEDVEKLNKEIHFIEEELEELED